MSSIADSIHFQITKLEADCTRLRERNNRQNREIRSLNRKFNHWKHQTQQERIRYDYLEKKYQEKMSSGRIDVCSDTDHDVCADG